MKTKVFLPTLVTSFPDTPRQTEEDMVPGGSVREGHLGLSFGCEPWRDRLWGCAAWTAGRRGRGHV